MPDAVDEYISRLADLDQEAEETFLTKILTEGFDQGCFLQPDPELLLESKGFAPLFEALAERAKASVDREVDDPFPGGREQEQIAEDAGDSGYVILTQRCDLIASIREEPVVELALAQKIERKSPEASSARKNSPRLLPITTDGDSAWVADMRVKVLLPKDRLLDYRPLQPIADEDRDRFRLRLGQRYTRDAVPEQLVREIGDPLGRVVLNKKNNELAAPFTDFLLRIVDGKPRIYAVVGTGFSQEQGDDAYDEIEKQLDDEVRERLHESSGAIHISKLHFLLWLTSLKLNFDAASFDVKKATADAAEPTR